MNPRDTYGTREIIVKLSTRFSQSFADSLNEIVSKILFWSSQVLSFPYKIELPCHAEENTVSIFTFCVLVLGIIIGKAKRAVDVW
jgi:hypothetical protein